MDFAFSKKMENSAAWKPWAAAVLSAGLLELPFPLAGPLPPWRALFAWCALVPLLWALLEPGAAAARRPLRRGFLLGYLSGALWYAGNCYWVRDVMLQYGDMPLGAPTLLLVAFSLYLGLASGFFGLAVALVRRATGSTRRTLIAVPFLWVAMELAVARIPSFPWDQLGVSQVDNGLLTWLAPWTGVYGISFVLMAANALFASRRLLPPPQPVLPKQPHWRLKALFGGQVWLVCAWLLIAFLMVGGIDSALLSPAPAPTATAALIQPNLNVAADNRWVHPGEWASHIAQFRQLAGDACGSYLAGIPQTGAPVVQPDCSKSPSPTELVVWPESPAPFVESDPRFEQALAAIARQQQAPLIVGSLGVDFAAEQQSWRDYNSALVIAADGARLGRYDKIHLVPFGEYIPFQRLLFFARKLTGNVGMFTPGDERKVFLLTGPDGERRRYGIFICYEAAFADEVRHFSQLGAEVLVNVSDDGWYGDTSAPWQHLNMARMRAIENRRWILRDTNNGVTAVIDPYGRVRQSIPRHVVGALAARFGFRDDVTFYTAHGDVFAWVCAILSLGLVGWSGRKLLRAWSMRAA